jgi:hypothetical protein
MAVAVLTKIVKGTMVDGVNSSTSDTGSLAYKVKQVTDLASYVYAVTSVKQGRIGTAVIVYEA